jgi:hypothetical protein|tara:strand:- start:7991 stop:8377 length:387 start_codon:yes stop_codon:yes gene_type:complete
MSDKYKKREEVGGFRVPKGTDEEQKRYKTAIAAQRIAAESEPVESLMERYGIEKDPYLAGLYKSYLSAPSSEMKEAYGEMIRQNVDPTVTDLIIGDGRGGIERRMARATLDQIDDVTPKVTLPSTVKD